MNFDLSEDDEMLKALAERFVSDRYDLDRRRAYLAEPQGFARDNWALLGELGLIGALFEADDGGLGLDATAVATVFEALGRGLVVEPLIENVLLAGRLFAAGATDSLRGDWLPRLLDGSARVALAHVEAGARNGNLWVNARARPDGDGAVLSGTKDYVPCGSGADGYIVTARDAGAPGDANGLGLWFVPAEAPGLQASSWRMADGTMAVSLAFDNVAARRLTGGADLLASAETLASLARAAEALGVMQRLFDDTLDYLRTRQQFGAPLASFQAIQHRMAAQYAAIEQSRALVELAIVSQPGASQPGEGFATAVYGARAFIADASLMLGHEMIQFHGGMGVTDELAVGHGHKRLLVLSRWPEDGGAALDRFAGIAA
ncbi:acyl-CoA dehydrogenase family protein [Novosphingobium lentum]|uniref:acyl-CoA dehydrogenase family protein n=1 Tax=Novosphingobium lentum TaxID=145287 RepID=UPI00082C084D|nr:acyl-CoA dehydrogenase family protein [Novosphingobium lentum]